MQWVSVPVRWEGILSILGLCVLSFITGIYLSLAAGVIVSVVAIGHAWLVVWHALKQVDPHKM